MYIYMCLVVIAELIALYTSTYRPSHFCIISKLGKLSKVQFHVQELVGSENKNTTISIPVSFTVFEARLWIFGID